MFLLDARIMRIYTLDPDTVPLYVGIFDTILISPHLKKNTIVHSVIPSTYQLDTCTMLFHRLLQQLKLEIGVDPPLAISLEEDKDGRKSLCLAC